VTAFESQRRPCRRLPPPRVAEHPHFAAPSPRSRLWPLVGNGTRPAAQGDRADGRGRFG